MLCNLRFCKNLDSKLTQGSFHVSKHIVLFYEPHTYFIHFYIIIFFVFKYRTILSLIILTTTCVKKRGKLGAGWVQAGCDIAGGPTTCIQCMMVHPKNPPSFWPYEWEDELYWVPTTCSMAFGPFIFWQSTGVHPKDPQMRDNMSELETWNSCRLGGYTWCANFKGAFA